MVKRIYARIWPLLFIGMGIFSLFEQHFHWKVFGLSITAMTLMWFLMGLAHLDRWWTNGPEESHH